MLNETFDQINNHGLLYAWSLKNSLKWNSGKVLKNLNITGENYIILFNYRNIERRH